MGYDVINPAALRQEELSYETIMEIDMLMLSKADYLVQLPGWEDSKGANRELGYALATGKTVVSLEELLKEGSASMDLQSTYDYLMQIRKKEYAIKRKLLRCEELRSCLGAQAIRYDVDHVHGSPKDKMSEIICKVADLEAEVEELKREKALLIIEIGDAIEQLEDDNEKTVLAEFYIGRVPMDQVAEIISYSRRRTYYFRKQGVLHLGELLADPGGKRASAGGLLRKSRQTLHK